MNTQAVRSTACTRVTRVDTLSHRQRRQRAASVATHVNFRLNGEIVFFLSILFLGTMSCQNAIPEPATLITPQSRLLGSKLITPNA